MYDSDTIQFSSDFPEFLESFSESSATRFCFRHVSVFVAYFFLLLWRFITLILFSIHATDCLFQEKHASYSCKNFTLFSHATELEISWQIASVINTLIVIAALVKVPDYRGYLSSLRSNSKHARFWSLFLQLIAFLTSKSIVISTGLPAVSACIQIDYIVMAISTTLVVYLWNEVPTPWKDSTPTFRVARGAYISTLVVFTLEYFYLFVITTAQTAFQVTGLYYSYGVSSAIECITVVLNAAEAAFHYSLMKFFWNKWFYGERNLLIDDSV